MLRGHYDRSCRRALPAKLGMLCGGLFFAFLAFAPPVAAVDFYVNSSGDGGDAVPGNGSCSTSTVFAVCTLRAAVEESNALPGQDNIFVGSRTVVVASQLLIEEDVFLVGEGRTTQLGATNGSRLLEVDPSARLSLLDLEVSGISTASSGGAIYNRGELEVHRVWFRSNQASSCGAIWTRGFLLVINSTFSGNEAGVSENGGALCVTHGAEAYVWQTTFTGNSAGNGGAISLTWPGTTLDLLSSTLVDNIDLTATPPTSSALYVGLGSTTLRQTLIYGTCDTNGNPVATEGVNVEGPAETCLDGGVNDLIEVTRQQLAISPLSHYGGSVPTMLPAIGSVAIDPVLDYVSCSGFDARDEPRLNSCDVGAVERQPGDALRDPIFYDGFESGDVSSRPGVVEE